MSKKQVEFYRLMTEAGDRMKNKEEVWQEYPRPQFVRDNWQCLNGIWELDGSPVRVPFVRESILSGYQGQINTTMTYTKCFTSAKPQKNKRVLLHFGAVDQIAEVFLNGTFLGKHAGGYAPFSFDVTEVIREENRLEVKVTDELNKDYPYGKQCRERGGMWYTPVSGIWQSVWLEQVPETYMESVRMTPDSKGVHVQVNIVSGRIKAKSVVQHGNKEHVEIQNGIEKEYKSIKAELTLHTGEIYKVDLCAEDNYIDLSKIVSASGEPYEPQLWEPAKPYLYYMTLRMGEDVVKTYFALRTIEIKNVGDVNRVCLNGKPLFMHRVLDQGYFPDGIFTPAEEKEYERDILRMKELGLNMLRKHIKVEPECFYYYCDLHGMLVMQDMVSNGYYSFMRDTALPTVGLLRRKDTGKGMSEEQKRLFEEHMLETQKLLYNHPCIVAYTIFNEGWGQFESDRLYALAKKTDPTRLYDATSGWFAQMDNDFDSIHIYFGPRKPKVKQRPVFLSEFGGYSYLVPEHIYTNKSYGYGTCKTSEELFRRLEARYEELVIPYIREGLCGSIYTQLSDVEDEINGLYTYDRKVCKVNPADMLTLADRIYKEMAGI